MRPSPRIFPEITAKFPKDIAPGTLVLRPSENAWAIKVENGLFDLQSATVNTSFSGSVADFGKSYVVKVKWRSCVQITDTVPCGALCLLRGTPAVYAGSAAPESSSRTRNRPPR